jgi:2-dehydropantoate 2-reductase
MKVAIMGVGGVGGYFGGRLAKAGHEVAFIARRATLEALRTSGLRVESINGNFVVPRVHATDDPAEAGPVDAVLIGVKAWQVPEVARRIGSLIGPQTVVLPLQNGVDAYQQLAAAVGAEHVLGGLCHIIAFTTAPGTIKHAGISPLITVGEWNNQRTPRLEKLVDTLRTAGVETRIPENIQVALWDKFMYIASFAGVGAVTRAPIGVVRSVPETRSLLQRAMGEIVGLAHALGIPLPDEAVPKAMKLVDSLPAEGTASMQRDVAGGKPSELGALSGAVVRLGKAPGVSTPIHEFIYAALLPSEMNARGEIGSED